MVVPSQSVMVLSPLEEEERRIIFTCAGEEKQKLSPICFPFM